MTGVKERLPGAVVFDLDGTLVDSIWDLIDGLNVLMARVGRTSLDRDAVVMMVGDGLPKLVERAFLATGDLPKDSELADHVAWFADYYEANATARTQPYPGAVRALEGLRDAGVRLGVCTNKPAGATAEVLDKLDLARFFTAVAGGDTVPGRRKPDPAHLHHVLAGLDVSAARAVMVGDNHNDVGVARAAQVPVIAVSFGYAHGPVAELGADRVIDHFDDLIPALKDG